MSAAGSQPSTSTAGSQPSTSTAGSQPSTSTADSEVPDIPPTTLNVDDFFVMRACSECKLILIIITIIIMWPGLAVSIISYSLFHRLVLQ